MLRTGCKQTVLGPAQVFSSRHKVQSVSKHSPKLLHLNLCKHKSCKRAMRCSCSQTSTCCSWLIKHTSQNTRMSVQLWCSFTEIIRFSNETGDCKNSWGAPMTHRGFLSTRSSTSYTTEERSSQWQVRSGGKRWHFGLEGSLATVGRKVWETTSDKIMNNKSHQAEPTLAIVS